MDLRPYEPGFGTDQRNSKGLLGTPKPIVNGNARGTLTFTYAEGDNLKGKKLYNNKVVGANSPDGEVILDGEPIKDDCRSYWVEKQRVEKKDIETVVFDASFANFRPTSCKEYLSSG